MSNYEFFNAEDWNGPFTGYIEGDESEKPFKITPQQSKAIGSFPLWKVSGQGSSHWMAHVWAVHQVTIDGVTYLVWFDRTDFYIGQKNGKIRMCGGVVKASGAAKNAPKLNKNWFI